MKFDVHRVDNMVIQSIALLDQLDKDINRFGMRIREWYGNLFSDFGFLYFIFVNAYLSTITCFNIVVFAF